MAFPHPQTHFCARAIFLLLSSLTSRFKPPATDLIIKATQQPRLGPLGSSCRGRLVISWLMLLSSHLSAAFFRSNITALQQNYCTRFHCVCKALLWTLFLFESLFFQRIKSNPLSLSTLSSFKTLIFCIPLFYKHLFLCFILFTMHALVNVSLSLSLSTSNLKFNPSFLPFLSRSSGNVVASAESNGNRWTWMELVDFAIFESSSTGTTLA